MNIVFPELNHPTIQEAIIAYNTTYPLTPITALGANTLAEACDLVINGHADTIIAGIEYSSRDVILACRDNFGMGSFADASAQATSLLGVPISNEAYSTFSGLAVMQSPDDSRTILLSDMAACKHPNREQLIEIIEQTYLSALALLPETPRIALLSFSTYGSGGHDDTIDLMHDVLNEFHSTDIIIDGEMQLDAAINPAIAAKKMPSSPVAGRANVLIAPDLNSGNLLYKAFEQIGGYRVAGPILQGFNFPVSDLSRGSSIEDVLFTITNIIKLINPSQ